MGELIMGNRFGQLTTANRISAEDVLALRQGVFRDGAVSRVEAEQLFALDGSCRDKCAEWDEFFVEAVSDFIVHQEQPQGHVSIVNARWLIRAISHDGVVDTRAELEILMRTLEIAKSVPEELSAFALRQVAKAVIEGEGALVKSGRLERGVIGQAEVAMLRRILYAASSDGNLAITRAEAEVLFDLNDRTVEMRNAVEWSDLFVKALANFLMSASGYSAPTREVALQRDEWLDDTSVSLGGFMQRMVSGGLKGILDSYSLSSSVEEAFGRRNEAIASAISSAEPVSEEEARWLADRIGRDGRLHANEKALIAFLREESPSIHPVLDELLARAA